MGSTSTTLDNLTNHQVSGVVYAPRCVVLSEYSLSAKKKNRFVHHATSGHERRAVLHRQREYHACIHRMIGIENTILLAIESFDSRVLHTAGFVLVGIAALCRGNVVTYCGMQAP